MQNGVIILAAGKGTRMKSNIPKVLHSVGGKPMILHLTELAQNMGAKPVVIYGHGGQQLQEALANQSVTWVEQTEQLGTGHAVQQALKYLANETLYYILVGDAPLVRQETLEHLGKTAQPSGIAVLTVRLSKPTGYGRIARDADGRVNRIIEEKDANDSERKINEINSGVFAVTGKLLKELLPKLNNQNSQKEYYLTDIVELASDVGYDVNTYCLDDMNEVLGCNNKVQLAQLERIYQQRQAEQLMLAGATISDPMRIDIRGKVDIGINCFIDINTVFIGQVTLGENVSIAPNCVIENSTIGSNTCILANTIIENSQVGNNVNIGPFARLRPKTKLADKTKIGNFVETKNVQIAEGSKVNHLSYIGDATIAENVNIGAGTITCNYDGQNKHQTTIGKDAFIGSNSALVAPVNVGKNVTIAAGSVITRNVDDNSLAIARARQSEIKGWRRFKLDKNQ